MYAPCLHIKRTAGSFLLSAAFLMALSLPCLAQHKKALPDSLNTSVDNVDQDEPLQSTVTPPAEDSVRQDKAEEEPVVKEPPVFRSVSPERITLYKKDRDFAYANDPSWWKQEETEDWQNRFTFYKLWDSSAFFRVLIYTLLAGLVLFGLFRIITDNKMHLFYKTPRKLRSGEEDPVTDLGEEDMEKKIGEALQAKDQKLATRYLFLKALQLLKGRELIRYQARSTNAEYLAQMKGQPQEKGFRFLAGAYEYIWYGDFSLNESRFEGLLQDFRDFYKTIGG